MAHDALSQVLDAVKLRGSIYFHTHFSPPWGVRVPAYGRVARFHMALRGDCWLRVKGSQQALRLATGDLAVIPHGAEHILSDAPDREAIDVDEVVQRSGYVGEGALVYGDENENLACKLFCGHFEFDEGTLHPILQSLPDVIHVPNTQSMNAYWLESMLRFVSAEITADRAGSEAIIHRLSEIVFIQVIRTFVDDVGDDAGSLAAVLHPQFGRCLSKVHAAPEEQWTVETMASEAGMSRTVFAERFSALMGMTPLGYVTHWRMQQARRKLIDTELPLIEIAEGVGYGSEAAFSRAFKRQFDVTPGELRRHAH